MAEETNIVLTTPETVRLDGVRSISSEGKPMSSKGLVNKQLDPCRASTGSFRNGGKKVSSGKPISMSKVESPVPHYLRASTGSCHDFCKHGIKHEREVKPWQVKPKKVIKPTLNQQNESQSRDLSEKKITNAVKPKPQSVPRTNSPDPAAVPVKKNSKEKITTVKEKDKNVLERRHSIVLSGKRESEAKIDKKKETSKEAMRKLVSFPTATKPSFDRASSLKVDANRSKQLESPLVDKNKIAKPELKHQTKKTFKGKILPAIKVEAKSMVRESSEVNQEEIVELENDLVENVQFIPKSEQNESTFEESRIGAEYTDSEKKVPELRQIKSTFDSRSIESFSSPNIVSSDKAPAMLHDQEEVQDELEYAYNEKEVPESKQNESTFDSPQAESYTSSNISSLDESPALLYGEEEDEFKYANMEKKGHESNQDEVTVDSPSSESFATAKTPAFSNGDEAQDELEYANCEKNVHDSEQDEGTNDSSLLVSFTSMNIPFVDKSPDLSNAEKEAKDELECTNSENKIPNSKQDESSVGSPLYDLVSSLNIPVLNESPVLSNKKENKDEAEYTEKEVYESKQNESTFDSPSSESFSSFNIVPAVKSPDLPHREEAQDDLEYTNGEEEVSDRKKIESPIDSPQSDSFTSLNIPSLDKCSALVYGEEAAQDVLEHTNSEKQVPELEQHESLIDFSLPESFTSLNISSLDKSPAVSSGEEAQNELEYTYIENKVPESEQNESTTNFHLSESFTLNIPAVDKNLSLSYGEIEAQDELVYLDIETDGSDDSISESSETINSDDVETYVGDSNIQTRKAKLVSEGNDPATKLKFRRGKVIEIESNNNGPRRLRFRKARTLDENQDNVSNSRRRSFENRGVVDDTDSNNDDSERVVLRHQQVEGKKDAQGLFNNVIEETASKLAETRKSKVKALVGAFETVISLQESKPSSQIAS